MDLLKKLAKDILTNGHFADRVMREYKGDSSTQEFAEFLKGSFLKANANAKVSGKIKKSEFLATKAILQRMSIEDWLEVYNQFEIQRNKYINRR